MISPILTAPGWAPEVRQALEAMIRRRAGEKQRTYAVFDFDNTCSVFDLEEQTVEYQLQTMAFAAAREEMEAVLSYGLPQDGQIRALIGDCAAAYRLLFDAYGPFGPEGAERETEERIAGDPVWQGFAARMRFLYDEVGRRFGHDTAGTWLKNWFCGMTPRQLYDLAARAMRRYRQVPTHAVTWQTPEGDAGRSGPVRRTWLAGVSVSEEIRELLKVFCDSGIDVYICSASHREVIAAGIDELGLHDRVTGLYAVVNREKDGRFLCGCDPDACGRRPSAEGWEEDVSQHAVPQGEGKAECVRQVLVPRYGRGPVAGFMDSTGDFWFCTGFPDMEVCVCFNRADRLPTDGGGLIAEIAVLMRERGWDPERAASEGETLYVLQGRDENGLRGLRPEDRTLRFGCAEPVRFASAANERMLEQMRKDGGSVRQLLAAYAVRGTAPDGTAYGFTDRLPEQENG